MRKRESSGLRRTCRLRRFLQFPASRKTFGQWVTPAHAARVAKFTTTWGQPLPMKATRIANSPVTAGDTLKSGTSSSCNLIDFLQEGGCRLTTMSFKRVSLEGTSEFPPDQLRCL